MNSRPKSMRRGINLFPRNRWKAGHEPVRPALGCGPYDLSTEDPGEDGRSYAHCRTARRMNHIREACREKDDFQGKKL